MFHASMSIMVNAFIATKIWSIYEDIEVENFNLRKFRKACHNNYESVIEFCFDIARQMMQDINSESIEQGFIRVEESQMTRTEKLESMRKLQEKIPKRYRQKFFNSSDGRKLRLTQWPVPHAVERPAKIQRIKRLSIYNKAAKEEFLASRDENRVNETSHGNGLGSPKIAKVCRITPSRTCIVCYVLCTHQCSVCKVLCTLIQRVIVAIPLVGSNSIAVATLSF